MVKSYCIKEKKQNECVQPFGWLQKKKWQNNVLVYLCIMWYSKDPFCEKSGKLAGHCWNCTRHVCASQSSLDWKEGAGNKTMLW